MMLDELSRDVMKLPDSQRARLAAELLWSLPPVLEDADEGIAEARRRLQELENDPSAGLRWEEVKREIGR